MLKLMIPAMAFVVSIFASAAVSANCDRYYITYIENQTDGDIEFGYKDKEYKITMDSLKSIQKYDLEAIFHNARTPVPTKCRYFINGHDLVPGEINDKSNLDLIYEEIANDGTEAPVDLFVLTHGGADGTIEVLEETAVNGIATVEDALLKQIPDTLRNRLGVFMDAACYGLSANLQAIKAGFSAAVGSPETTLGPLVLREFLEGYLNGYTLKETAQDMLYNCSNDPVWTEVIRVALREQDYQTYCKEAVLAIVGDPNLTVDADITDLRSAKQEDREEVKRLGAEIEKQVANYKTELPSNSSNFHSPLIPYRKTSDTSVEATAQYGDNPIYQVDVHFDNKRIWKYVNLERVSIDNRGYVGGKVSFLHEDSYEVMGIERDYKKGILFKVTMLAVDKSWFVTGKTYSNGLSWKYAFSTEGKVGYVRLRGKNGNAKSFANIGVKANNSFDVSYKNFLLQTDSGYDFMPLHLTASPVYSNGSLLYRKGKVNAGGYYDYNGFTGFSAGLRIKIDL